MAGSGVTVLVTGGAGYAGSHTALVLLQGGYQVVVVDSCVNCAASPPDGSGLPPSLERVQQLCGKSVIFYKMDMADAAGLTEVFKKVSKHETS